MTITEIVLSNYTEACHTLARTFCDHMGYDYDDGDRAAPTYPPHVFDISDTFWTIEDMYMTLEHNMPSDMVFGRYWDRVEEKTKFNLYNYYLQGKQSQSPDYKTLENQH